VHPTTAMSYEALRTRHCRFARALVSDHLERLRWTPERLAAERLMGLRALIFIARERSSWHRRRLAGIDPKTLTETDLERIPPMSKDDLMDNFDAIVTDPRLSLEAVESHLAGLTDDAYLLDEHHALASGGSSGRRGVFVYGWDAWARAHVGFFRYLLRDWRPAWPTHPAPVFAVLASATLSHFSAAHPRTFSDPALIQFARLPLTLPTFPLERLVAELNALQPTILSGYPTALHQLAAAARTGALRIRPQLVVTYSEPLSAGVREALEQTWMTEVRNIWGTSEGGPTGVECAAGGLHLSDDLLIYEPVDAVGRPVPVGESADRLLLTNLYNPVLPLIRYELADGVTLSDAACPCGSTHRLLAALHGRRDQSFRYDGGLVVPAVVFDHRLERERHIIEYQVRQSARGATIHLRCSGPIDLIALARGIAADLAALGLERPEVPISVVAHLERQATGKLARFLPLPRDRVAVASAREQAEAAARRAERA